MRTEFAEKCVGSLSFCRVAQTEETMRVDLPDGYGIEAKFESEIRNLSGVQTLAELTQAYEQPSVGRSTSGSEPDTSALAAPVRASLTYGR